MPRWDDEEIVMVSLNKGVCKGCARAAKDGLGYLKASCEVYDEIHLKPIEVTEQGKPCPYYKPER